MKGVKWTAEQLEAITETGRNLLVAAAAGAGKTAVLVERIIGKITDENNPVDIDTLLIVTFTNAAATEMREKIGNALERVLNEKPSCTGLQRQLSLLNKATITTIHSFCLETVRNNFHIIDIDPAFRIADETETVLMKLEAMEETLEKQYESSEQHFLKLAECYGGKKDDEMLQRMVLNLYHYVQSHPWPEVWLRESAEAFNLKDNESFENSKWGRVLTEDAKLQLNGMRDMMTEAIDVIKNSKGLDAYLNTYLEDRNNIEGLLGMLRSPWEDLRRSFMGVEFQRLPRCGREADVDRREYVKGIRDEVKKQLRAIREDVFRFSSAEVLDAHAKMYPLMNSLADLVLAFGKKYSEKKKERAVLDFNDLEHYCLEILTETDREGNIIPSAVAEAYSQRFNEILMDEYQDTNLIQEAIVEAISPGGEHSPPVFAVGDVKQSIYRFRQSRPELFLEKYKSYPSETGKPNRKITLYKNFRSRDSIIKAVNRVFGHIMSPTVGELNYTEDEALNYGARYPKLEDEGLSAVSGGPVEIHIIDRADDGDGAGLLSAAREQSDNTSDEPVTEDEPDAIQAEAMLIAGRIKEIVGTGEDRNKFKVYDKTMKGYRDVQFRDIVVLLRATKNWAEIFAEQFELAGIPVYAETSTGYFGTVEVRVMISLLQIIDNPMQDIPLLAVLKSPIGGFTPEELIDIRLHNKDMPIYQAMKGFADKGTGDTVEKTKVFLENLSRWRNRAGHSSTDELLWHLLSDTNFYSFVGAMPGGAQRQANLRMLYEGARQYEETSYRGLFNFINFINNLKSGNSDMGSARVLGEDENVVRLMSIHKSKGLEFPVVIVAGCGKGFNFQDMNRSLLVHQDLGFGPDYVDPEMRFSRSTLAKEAVKCRIKLEMLSEEMRILYVALTRAREKLIITGAVRDFNKVASRWEKNRAGPGTKLAKYRAVAARNYFDWLGPCFFKGDNYFIPEGKGTYDKDKQTRSPGTEQDYWQVTVWNKNEITKAAAAAAPGATGEPIKSAVEGNDMEASSEIGIYSDEIKKRLDWRYKHKKSARLPAKLSVTELKRQSGAEFAEEYRPLEMYSSPIMKKPSFLDESKGFSGAEKGSILHFAMQHLNLQGTLNQRDIKAQVTDMVNRELLTQREAQAVDIEGLEKFFSSSLGQRMLKSDNVKREVPFNFYIRSTDVYEQLDAEAYGGELILLQGIIDCFFEEAGGIVLVDYKTDYVPEGRGKDQSPENPLTPALKEIMKRYQTQMGYYGMALKHITGKPLRGKYLYLFHTGDILKY